MGKKKNSTNKYVGKRCNEDEYLICPVCGAYRTAKEWDDDSFAKCKTREERRDFRSVTLNISKRRGEHKDLFFYSCNKCNTLIAGCRFKGTVHSLEDAIRITNDAEQLEKYLALGAMQDKEGRINEQVEKMLK